MKRIHEVGYEVLGLVEGLINMGPSLLSDEIGTGVVCSTLILPMIK